MEPKGMLIDLTKCMGCRSCQVACKQWNNLPTTSTSFNPDWSNPPGLSANTWTRLDFHLSEEGDDLKWRFVKQQCMHCDEPACESACFVHALTKTPEGPVVYNADICVGCRYCMVACPFSIPKYQWDARFPKVQKCDLCAGRQAAGLQPACAAACPSGAIKFGGRAALLEEAWGRIRGSNGKYVKRVFGEKEVGGTSVLYLSDVQFEKLGFPAEITAEPLPQYTWKALSKIPAVLVGWGGFLVFMTWYSRRRSQLEEKQKAVQG